MATVAALALVGAVATSVRAGSPGAAGDTTADSALGQTDFAHGIFNFGGLDALSGFFSGGPAAVTIDPRGHFYAADIGNNRVLAWEFRVGFTDGAPATIVIGQPDAYSNLCTTTQTGLCFSSPVNCAGLAGGGLAVDTAGNLYVADGCNSRVLEFDAPFSQTTASGHPLTAGQAAHLVFGQNGSFTSNNSGASENCGVGDTICTPSGIATDLIGNLYVVDQSSNRVLEYNTPLTPGKIPGSGDTMSDRIIGGLGCNETEGPNTLCSPTGAAVDSSGNLYVADTHNGRVLEYNSPLLKSSVAGSGDSIADTVFGQNGSFTSNPCSAPSSQCLGAPTGVSVDFGGNVYISDGLYNRVLEYNTPLKKNPGVKGSGDSVADRVFGQNNNFKTQVCSNGIIGNGASMGATGVVNPAPSTKGLCDPEGVASDLGGDLYIADSGNGRVLFYDLPLVKAPGLQSAGDTIADLEVGQTSFTHNMNNFGGTRALSMPASVVTDSAGHLYVSDGANNRVLGWKKAAKLASGAPADIQIGQVSFYGYACTTTRTGLCLSKNCQSLGTCNSTGAGGLAVDRSGNLYIADTYNNRVMEFDSPFTSTAGSPAHRVFGQNGKFTTSGCSAGAQGMCAPSAVAIDSSGNLYVSDSGNNRVLEFNNPIKKAGPGSGNTVADLAFGQPDFNGNQCNSGTSASATSLCAPQALTVDSAENLYVADFGNNRVLEYNTPLAATATAGSGDTTADTVFGQGGDFSTSACAGPGATPSPPAADGLCGPSGVALDSAGNLYISDSHNNRVLEYNTPLAATATAGSGDTTADTVFGQGGNFTTSTCTGGGILSATPTTPTPDGLCSPQGITVDASGNLWVTDNANNRALEFDQPIP